MTVQELFPPPGYLSIPLSRAISWCLVRFPASHFLSSYATSTHNCSVLFIRNFIVGLAIMGMRIYRLQQKLVFCRRYNMEEITAEMHQDARGSKGPTVISVGA